MAESMGNIDAESIQPDIQASTPNANTDLDTIRTQREEYRVNQLRLCQDALNGSCSFLSSVESWDERVITEDGVGLAYRVYANPEIAQALKDLGKSSERNTDIGIAGSLIYIHGGGWRVGDLDSEDVTCRRLCHTLNFAVFSINYRKVPEHPYPIPVRDSIAGIKAANVLYISKLSHLPVYIEGSSSGGHLAALISQMVAAGKLKLKLDLSILRCPVTVHPDHVPENFKSYYNSYILNDTKGEIQGMAERMRTLFILAGFSESDLTSGDAFPLNGKFEGHPQTYIELAEDDVLRDDGSCYGKALEAAGVPVKVKNRKGDHTWWLKNYGSPEADAVEEDFANEVKEYMIK